MSIFETPDDPSRTGDYDHDPCRAYDDRWQQGQDTQDERRDAAVYEGDLAADCRAIHMLPQTIRTPSELLHDDLKQIANNAVTASRFDQDFKRIFGAGKC